MKTVSIIVEVPEGNYCAIFGELGLQNRCPLLKNCGEKSFFCPIANYDTHCGKDRLGVLKQRDYYNSICPSLYQDRIMELIRENSSSSKS